MARTSKQAPSLHKLLDSAGLPVYVLDERRRITYCNQACARWIGVAAEKMVGLECRYHSQDESDRPRRMASALCPPPAVFEGLRIREAIQCPGASGELLQRSAEFIPLLSESAAIAAVVVFLDREDAVPPEESKSATGGSDASRLHELIARYRSESRSRYLDRLIGRSPAICRARAQIALAAQSDATVWIVGPPGSGREHVARAIHYRRSQGAEADLIPLSCALLGADLLRSTIGALRQAPPKPAAARGTLLLNEIDRAGAELQAELVGSLAQGFPLHVISTATESVAALLDRGGFRENLACLLSTLTIQLPALTQRPEDIPPLAQSLLEDENASHEKQLGGFSEEALDRLVAYSWPGNVDELADVVRHAHQRANDARIDVDDLPQRILLDTGATRPKRADEMIVLDDFLAHVETLLIRRALSRSKGNKARAARLLGVTRPRLYRRMVQLDLAGDAKDQPSGSS